MKNPSHEQMVSNSRAIYILPSQLTIDEDGYVQVHLTDADLIDAGLIDSDEAEDDRQCAVDEAREEAAREARENIWEYGCRSALDDLARAAEAGRVEDQVSPTDLILHGPTVAALRAAIDIVAQTIGAQEAWRA